MEGEGKTQNMIPSLGLSEDELKAALGQEEEGERVKLNVDPEMSFAELTGSDGAGEDNGSSGDGDGDGGEDDSPAEPKYSEEASDIAIAVYEELRQNNFLPELEGFDGTINSLNAAIEDNVVDVLAHNETARFEIAKLVVSEAPESVQKLLHYGFANPNATREDLQEFFQLGESAVQVNPVTTAEEATAYLDTELAGMIPSETARKAAIEELSKSDDPDYIVNFANGRIDAYNASLKNEQDAKLAELEAERQAKIEKSNVFYKQVEDELGQLGYKPERVSKIAHQVQNKGVENLMTIALENPRAFIQLADLVTYFDKDTGGFDLSAFAAQAGTSSNKQKKDAMQSKFNSLSVGTGSKTRLKQPNEKKFDLDNVRPILE